jgi:hypothetical protein
MYPDTSVFMKGNMGQREYFSWWTILWSAPSWFEGRIIDRNYQGKGDRRLEGVVALVGTREKT